MQPLGRRFWLAFWAIAVSNLTASFDATMLSVALPTISAELGGSSTEAFWAGTSYLLASTVLMLIWGTLSDAFGRRIIILAALLVFALGTILCGVAHSWTMMLAGRTVQGIGGGGIVSLTTMLVTDMAPLRERARLYALIACIWTVGTATGPIIGGGLSKANTWRWIFWINLPIITISFVGIAFFLRLSQKPRSLSEKLCLFDYPGSLLFIASTTTFLIPVTWGGTQYPWSGWQTIVPLILGIIGIVLFGIYEFKIHSTKLPQARLIPSSIFANRSACIGYASSTVHGMVVYSLLYYMAEYFQTVKMYSPVIAGAASLPQSLTAAPCAVVVGIIVAGTGKYRWALWAGWSLVCLGCGLLVLLDTHTAVPEWIFLEAVSGLGLGLLFPSINLSIQASVPQHEAGIAATLVLFFRSLGQALGVAIGGTIFDNRLRANLENSVENAPSSIMALMDRLHQLPLDEPISLQIRDALSRSFHVIWIVMCAFAGLSLLLSFLMKEYDMNQEHQSDQVFLLKDMGGPSPETTAGQSSQL
ncbi:MFS domain-containing protein [Trichoderma simmonsii]|uniref:MFS domain-containing protein n=1 Tax=Trichoderma simmonsii TaxID=1491479 RepID=A0A8G0LGA1_9HYPO|nr:MFS domain-containing protein [Trichoderma simmonsii]